MSFLNQLFGMMTGGANRIGVAEAKQHVDNGATLVDVRSPGEFAGGHLPGAKNIPVGDISTRKGKIPSDKPVVVYCRSGARSASAAGVLESAGYEVYDIGPMPSSW